MRSLTRRRLFAVGLAVAVIVILGLSTRHRAKTPSGQLFPWPTAPQEDQDNLSPPHPPSDLQAGRATNRAMLGTEYIDVLQWQPNLENVGTEIANFRIYRLDTGHRILLAEVSSTAYEHWVRGFAEDNTRYYGVTAVSRDGRESKPAVVSIDTQGAQ